MPTDAKFFFFSEIRDDLFQEFNRAISMPKIDGFRFKDFRISNDIIIKFKTKKAKQKPCLAFFVLVINFFNLFLRNVAIRAVITEIVRRAYYKVSTGQFGQILFHIKAPGKSDQDIEK